MIKVLLFARLQEEAGKDSLTVEKADISVDELKSWLEEEYKFSSLSNTMTAVNENYIEDGSVILSEGDTVALIPPVSGG